MTSPAGALSVARIEEAARVVDPVFLGTPQFESDVLSDRLGCRLVCKVETLNPIRSFKGRGTDYLMHTLTADGGRIPHLVCASAGNFGQGMAYAARRRGLAVTVFAAETANARKVDRMKRLGADVRIAGRDFDAAKDAARAWAAEREDARFIEDGREPAVSEGAGTIALELTRGALVGALDAVVVPLGNGALLSGIGHWMRAHAPETRVIGVVAANAPAMERSWREGRVVVTDDAPTIADGIAVRVPVPEALEQLAGVVDDIVLVGEDAIRDAARLALETLGVVVEPAGVAGLAAIMADAGRWRGARLATPLCGGWTA